MKKRIALCLLPLLALLPLHAATDGADDAEQPKPALAKGDIEKFIQTFPRIVEAYEALGHEIESREDLSSLQTLAANEKARAILKQYGWDLESFGRKIMAISTGYAAAEIEKQMAKLSEQERAMYKSMMGQAFSFSELHPDDLDLIKKKLPELTRLFESME